MKSPLRKGKSPISRAFKQDFPEFVDRATALGVRIQLSPGRRSGHPRAYWLDGYLQLTGYTTKKSGGAFTDADARRNIDKCLTDIEEGRRKISTMSQDERFARVIAEFRKMTPRYRMIGEVRLPGGDRGHCWFMASYDGEIRLRGIGTVAKAEVKWRDGATVAEQMAAFVDALEADYAARAAKEGE